MDRKLPDGWGYCSLLDAVGGETSNVVGGPFGSNLKVSDYRDSGIPIIRLQNIDWNHFVNKDIKYISSEKASELDYHSFKAGDIVIAKLGDPIGKACIIPDYLQKGIVVADVVRVRNSNPKLDTNYLTYALNSPASIRQLNRQVFGTTRPRVNLEQIRDLSLPIPPLDTQRKIVAILDKAEETKRLRAQANEQTQKLLQSVFLEMFGDPIKNLQGWDFKRVEELASEIVDCPHSTPDYVDDYEQYPCIRTTELKAGYIDWSDMKYVDKFQYSERTKRLVPSEGDIIYGREGTFGIAVKVPEKVKLCLGQRVMLFRPDSKLCTSEFLWALLNSPSIYRQALSKTSGSTVGHVNVKDIVRFVGFCPPMQLQEKYSMFVKKLESLRNSQSVSNDRITRLLNSAQIEAFTGELVA